MARPAKKQPAQKFEEPDEAEGWEDAVVDADDKDGGNLRLRDWRDVERFREMKELRRLVDDDYGLEEIFHIPMKPRTDLRIPAPHTPAGKVKPMPLKAVPAKEAPKAAPGKHAPAPIVAKPHAPVKAAKAAPKPKPVKPAAKHKPAPAKPAKVKAKAKRR